MSTVSKANSLNQVLEQAEIQFSEITKQNVRSLGSFGLEDVVTMLDHKFDTSSDPDAQRKKAQTKLIITGVLTGLQVLNGLAAQAASTILPNSNVCFNAVGFLLTVPKKISQLHDGVGELFKEINSYLVRFKILRRTEKQAGAMAQEIIDSTGAIMQCFVRLCARCYEAWTGGFRSKFKLAFKAVFNDEATKVKGELAEFENLVKKQEGVTNAITLETVLKTNQDMSDVRNITQNINAIVQELSQSAKETKLGIKIVDQKVDVIHDDINVVVRDVTDRKVKEESAGELDKLTKSLDLDNDSGKTLRAEQDNVLQRVARDMLPDSGQWLQDVEAYRKWLDTTCVDHLLVLRGSLGCGKHYLACQVANERSADETRYSVGYYHFTKSQTDTKDRELGPDFVSRALKTMAWQIARRNLPYRRELMRSCRAHDDVFGKAKRPTIEALWDALGFSVLSSKPSYTFVLVFDGFEQLELDAARDLSKVLTLNASNLASTTDKTHLRILVAGTDETGTNAKMQLLRDLPDVVVNDHNRTDIEAFIKVQLQDRAFESLNQLMETGDDIALNKAINEDLPRIVLGDYSNVLTKFKRLRAAIEADDEESPDPLAQIKKILSENSDEDRSTIAASTVAELDRDLSSREIKQLNVALRWLVYAKGYYTMGLLETVISLAGLKSVSQLSSFTSKVKDPNKFGRLITLETDYGDERVEIDKQIAKYLRQSFGEFSQVSDKQDADIANVTMTISFNRATHADVRNFFRKLSEAATADLGQLSSSIHVVNKDTIGADPDESYSSIAEVALDVLTDEPDPNTEELANWATYFLPGNLNAKQTDDDDKPRTITFRNRKKILRGIILMLSDVQLTLKHWSRRPYQMRYTWLDDDDNRAAVDTITAWLGDIETSQLLKPRYKRRLQRLLEDDSGRGGFWRPLTLEIAKDWLLTDNGIFDDSERWIDGFIMMQNAPRVEPPKEEVPASQPAIAEGVVPGIRRSRTTTFDDEDKPMLRRSRTTPIAALTEEDTDNLQQKSTLKPDLFDADTTLLEKNIIDNSDGVVEADQNALSQIVNTSATETSASEGPAEDLPWAVRIARAAEWVRKELSVAKLNATWYYRLAGTYNDWSERDKAIQILEEATQPFPRDWKIHDRLADTYDHQEKKKQALKTALVALDILESGDEPDEDNQKRIKCLTTIANLQIGLHKVDDAKITVESVLKLNPSDYSLRAKCLRALQKHNRDSDVDEFIASAKEQPSTESGLTELVHMIYCLSQSSWEATVFGGLTDLSTTMKRCNVLELATESIQDAIAHIRKQAEPDKAQIANLTLFEANALALTSQSEAGLELAFPKWVEVRDYYKASDLKGTWHHWFANQLLSSYYLRQATRPSASEDVKQVNVKLLEEISKEMPNWGPRDTQSYLTRYRLLQGQKAEARKPFASLMKDAFDILSNDDTSDDWLGYAYMADIFERLDEDENACTAWSLVGPVDRPSEQEKDETQPGTDASTDTEDLQTPGDKPKRKGNWGQVCDGRCEKEWTYADDFIRCKICPQTTFCRKCYEKLHNGSPDFYWCHADHSFLEIPPWPVADWPVGKAKVVIGGWAKPDGDTVDIEVWLERIRKEWDIEKSKGYDWVAKQESEETTQEEIED